MNPERRNRILIVIGGTLAVFALIWLVSADVAPTEESSDRSHAGKIDAAPPRPTEDDLRGVIKSPIAGTSSPGHYQRADPDGNLKQEFLWKRMTPQADGVIDAICPVARTYLSPTRVIALRSQTGKLLAPNNTPQAGRFIGDVVITIFQGQPGTPLTSPTNPKTASSNSSSKKPTSTPHSAKCDPTANLNCSRHPHARSSFADAACAWSTTNRSRASNISKFLRATRCDITRARQPHLVRRARTCRHPNLRPNRQRHLRPVRLPHPPLKPISTTALNSMATCAWSARGAPSKRNNSKCSSPSVVRILRQRSPHADPPPGLKPWRFRA